MNKKGELLTLAIIILLVFVVGVFYYENKTKEINYIGDENLKIAYNINSVNLSCNFNEIEIERNKIKLFHSLEEVKNSDYNISRLCP